MSFRTNTVVAQSIASAAVAAARGATVQNYSSLLDNIAALTTSGNAARPLVVNSAGTALVLGTALGTAAYAATGTAVGNIPVLGTGGKLAASVLPTVNLDDFSIFTDGAPLPSLTNARAVYDDISHSAGTTGTIAAAAVGDMSGALNMSAGSTANSGVALVGASVVPFKTGYSAGSSRVYVRMKRSTTAGTIARLGWSGGDPLNSASLVTTAYVEIPTTGNCILKFYNSSGTLVSSLDLGATTNAGSGNIFYLEMNYDYASNNVKVTFNTTVVGTIAAPGAVQNYNQTPFISQNYVSAAGSTMVLDYFGSDVSGRTLNVN